jgi:hypothetical protein
MVVKSFKFWYLCNKHFLTVQRIMEQIQFVPVPTRGKNLNLSSPIFGWF